MPTPATARLRVLHAIHDFLPRHLAGSEIYAFDLCQELSRRHHVTVLAAEYDPSRAHGHVEWRVQDGLPVAELINNWVGGRFEDTYRSPAITKQLGHVLDMVQPDVLHLHSLLNLSFDLPSLARARGIPVVATLHDYTLVCPSGGQRVHRADEHFCDTIEPDRCARCFTESPFHAQMTFGNLAAGTGRSQMLTRAAALARRHLPVVAQRVARVVGRRAGVPVRASEIEARLDRVRDVYESVDLFVAPSRFLGDEFRALGLPGSKLRVIDYGFAPLPRPERVSHAGPLRIGFTGTIVWHKGLHVLIDAVRALPRQDFELKIFGNPDVFPDYAADLRRRAEGLPVHFMGPYERSRTADVYRDIDVLVVPSIWPENSPLVIREAFMCGVPVVAARIGGMSGLIADGVNGLLFDPHSASDLTRALRSLIDDRARLETFASHLPLAKTMSAHAGEWDGIYAELLRPSRTATVS